MLNKLKPVIDIALIRDEEETATVKRLVRVGFAAGDFTPEGDALADDTTRLCRDSARWEFRGA
jgi:hypothetical protein